jgi:predicted dehydrogenase
MTSKLSRRKFIKVNSALAGFSILPSGLFSNSPNSRLCTAHIGIAGKGYTDTTQISADPRTEVIGLCDVDLDRLNGNDRKNRRPGQEPLSFPSARKFQDYREMLHELGDKIDAVSISTPDHTHYPATLAAMNLGKHVYTQKPLTNNISEARHLMQVARSQKVVTQMGIQNKATTGYRMATSFIRDGIIGKVSKVYVWSFKDWGYDGAPYKGKDPVPDYLDWNLWLGTAPMRSFLEGKYHPGQWRRMMDFGCGTLGDMGVHIFDTPFDSLGLEPPVWVEATCREPNNFSLPTQTKVQYGFKPTALTTKNFEWTWYDGTMSPPEGPDLVLTNDEALPDQGAMFVGEEGRMLLPHIAGPRFFPKSIYETLVKPELAKTVNHYGQWIDAIFGSKTVPAANFDYAGKMVEAVLLGVIAGRYPGQRIKWDTTKAKVTNITGANEFVSRKHRHF